MGYGKRIRELRERGGLSQEHLAEAAGISPSYLSRIEGDRVSAPIVAKLESIADALARTVPGVTLGSLLDAKTRMTTIERAGGRIDQDDAPTHTAGADGRLDELVATLGGRYLVELTADAPAAYHRAGDLLLLEGGGEPRDGQLVVIGRNGGLWLHLWRQAGPVELLAPLGDGETIMFNPDRHDLRAVFVQSARFA